ncbi:MAG TPA: hypothetical protein VFT34_02725 [Verrucomicrobiae bacterium]|nr:hypothetical protein [Verrucomicrobiae bacterium]
MMYRLNFLVGGLFILLLASPASGAVVPLVNHGDAWRYRKGNGSAPQSNWKTVAEAGLDGTWLTGNGGIGYADNTNETALCQTLLSDMHNAYTTVAMRKSFQITSNLDSSLHLMLTMDWDDGFIAWLDGGYLRSYLSPGAPAEPAYNADATGLHESSRGSSGQPAMTIDLGAIGSRLSIGTHVLAIIGLNELPSSSDFIQIADLALGPPPTNGLSGVIGENTTWRTTNSPILVAGDIIVNFGVTLTIEPGVHVLFNSNLSLIINGRLIAEGDPTHRILFSRSSGNAGRWGGIEINDSAGSPETRIRYGRVEFNGTDAILVTGGNAWLDHLTFGSNDRTYIQLDGASFIVSECEFPSASVKFELVHGMNGVKTGGHGLILRNFFGLPVGYSDVIDFTGGSRPGPILNVIDNVFSGASDDGLDIDGTDGWVEGNIFLHVHRNGDTPDSSSAVSGGNNSGLTSEVTIIGNLFFDCDNAVTAKQGNFFSLINNTILRTTKTGGIDGASGAVCVRDTTPSPTTFARGLYLEGNIIWDAEQLVRNYDAAQTTVTFVNNILPVIWSGPGTSNSVVNPLFNHVPLVSEAAFINWQQAQIVRQWFGLQPQSPGVRTGPNGHDKGGVIPLGAFLTGEPSGTTYQSNATLVVGVNRTGFGMPTTGWPSGCGYLAYRWRLDGGAWSAERPINSPIFLNSLATGPHYVEVTGKRDSGLYQDDPLFGPDAVVTRSRTWNVDQLKVSSARFAGPDFTVGFMAATGQTYTVQYRDAFDVAHPWMTLTNFGPPVSVGPVMVSDWNVGARPMRFYRIVNPAVP